MTATQTTEKPQTPDQVPPLPDDIQEAASAAAAAQPREREEGEPPVPAGLEVVKDDGRAHAAQRYRELRDRKAAAQPAAPAEAAQTGGEGAEETGTNESLEAPATVSQAAQEESAAAAEPSAEPAQAAQPTEITLLVDGKPKVVSLEEATRLAQMAAASDNRLDTVKQLATELRGVIAEAKRPPGPAHQPDQGQADTSQPDPSQTRAAPAHQPGKLDPEKLRDLAERIQVGTAEEGAQALADFAQSLGPSGPDEAAIGKAVKEHLNREAATREINDALAVFSSGKYAAIARDGDLKTAGLDMVRREIVADLEKVGIKPEDIAPLSGNLQHLATAHYMMRAGGHGVRKVSDLLDSVGATMAKKFNIPVAGDPQPQPSPRPAATPQPTAPTNASVAQTRQDLKRAAPVQPRSTGVRSQTPTAPPPPTRRDIVNQARKQRGFAVTT